MLLDRAVFAPIMLGLVLGPALGCGSTKNDDNSDVVDSGTAIDASVDATRQPIEVVVFSKTVGFRHDSIEVGIALVETLGAERGWNVQSTEDADVLVSGLGQTKVVVFCNTTGDVFDTAQEAAFEAFIRSGGGYVGIHSATDTEYGWPFYGELAGARFADHPAPQLATINLEPVESPIINGLTQQFEFNDEWYNFDANPRGSVTVLATLDEATYDGGTMGDHPIMWSNEIDQGRSFYTGLGHRESTFADAQFQTTLARAIEWVAQD